MYGSPRMREDPVISGRIVEELEYAPEIRGYTSEQLAEITGGSLKDVKRKLREMEKKGHVECHDLDGEKVYEFTVLGLCDYHIKKAPKIDSYIIKQLREIVETPWPTTRWWDIYGPMGRTPHFRIGPAKVYRLRKKKKKKN